MQWLYNSASSQPSGFLLLEISWRYSCSPQSSLPSLAVLHAVSLATAATVMTKAVNIITRRPHRVQVTVPSRDSPLTGHVPHLPILSLPSTLLLKPLRSLASIVSHHRTVDNALGLPRPFRLSPFVPSHSPSSLPAGLFPHLVLFIWRSAARDCHHTLQT
jgi:hypothetical protein